MDKPKNNKSTYQYSGLISVDKSTFYGLNCVPPLKFTVDISANRGQNS